MLRVERPRAELHAAVLLVERKVLHVDLARALVDGDRDPEDFARVVDDHVRLVRHLVLAVSTTADRTRTSQLAHARHAAPYQTSAIPSHYNTSFIHTYAVRVTVLCNSANILSAEGRLRLYCGKSRKVYVLIADRQYGSFAVFAV